jgi:3-oxoacid CoA-transferase subunit B
MNGWTREEMAARAAMELSGCSQVILGPGLPATVAKYLPGAVDVVHSAAHRGKNAPGATSPWRSGGAAVAVVEATQVSARGEIVGSPFAALASAVRAAKRVIVLMEHVAEDGSFNVVGECSLPHVGPAPVQRIITDLAVIDVLSGNDVSGTATRLRLVERAPGVSEGYLRRWTGPWL